MSNNRRENLMALKENLKNKIREDAQNVCDFEEMVNRATFKEIGCGRMVVTGDYVANRMMDDMCNRIIDSRMSMDDKGYILKTMSYLLYIAEMGSVLSAMDAEELQTAVEEEAEKFIKKNKDIAEKIHPTGGTTETHKTEVVE